MPRVLTAYTLGPSIRHGIGVFATRTLEPGTTIGRVHLKACGPISSFTTLPSTGWMRGAEMYAITGGFPFWYLNYGTPPNLELDPSGLIKTTALVLDGDELLFAAPFR